MSKKQARLSRILWHPHQGLWNWALVSRLQRLIPVALAQKGMYVAIVHLDTLILFLRAIATRISTLGAISVFRKASVSDDIAVLYLDLGTHKEGLELSLAVNELLPPICKKLDAYGFEASHESYREVARRFAGTDNVRIINKALVYDLPIENKLKLYKDMKAGIGNSIYRKSAEYEEVECLRLSEFLAENGLLQGKRIVLLRMNIEGAEYDVVKDLVEKGLHDRVDGYFGMWDDVSKTDPARDAEFRSFLDAHKIRPFTFNGRDLSWTLRRKCIAYHMQTCIMQGSHRLRAEP